MTARRHKHPLHVLFVLLTGLFLTFSWFIPIAEAENPPLTRSMTMGRSGASRAVSTRSRQQTDNDMHTPVSGMPYLCSKAIRFPIPAFILERRSDRSIFLLLKQQLLMPLKFTVNTYLAPQV
ncbi:hypothetical protein NLX71_09730 [Paenibacillus sp. MZ04-78.2]|uniref:hypothetical protein n=1 Tax=Paenibacillus sp. MZ04-78.2 TaxID=2962034 RepID=UPI0020B63D3A|nr:hypothetical protein [Paenibacillus sp. MZ04-78.2]MCP3773590.1 hypothetical protein [Paenibacillus sp. MZ04-78.2]